MVDALQKGLGLEGGGLEDVEMEILKAIEEAQLKRGKVVLVLEGIEFLLAATQTMLSQMMGMLVELREVWPTALL